MKNGDWRAESVLFRATGALLAGLVLLLVGWVIFSAMANAGGAWRDVLENRLFVNLWQTLLLASGVFCGALVIGLPAAWLVAMHDFVGRGIMRWLMVLPLAMPSFVAAGAYLEILNGMIPFYVWVRSSFGIEAFLWVQKIMPWVFSIVILSATLFPYIYLSCLAIFERQAADAFEVSRLLGVSGWNGFFRVGLPLARPAIAAGGGLVLMETFNDYGVVSAFGLTTLTPGIFRAWAEGEWIVAMRLALLLMVIASVILAVEKFQSGRKRFVSSDTERPLARVPLRHRNASGVWLLAMVPVALGFLLPCMQMLEWLWLTLHLLDWQGHFSAAWHSLSLALGAALLVVLSAAILVVGARVLRSGMLKHAQAISIAGYSLPSAMVAVGVGAIVTSISQSSQLFAGLALSASVTGLMLAYWVRFMAVAVHPLSAGLTKVPETLGEAARMLGERPWGIFFKIEIPLMWPAFFVAAALAFVDVFKELTLTLVLRPFDFETLATRAYRLTDEGRLAEAAFPGLSMVVLSLLGLIPLLRWMGRIRA